MEAEVLRLLRLVSVELLLEVRNLQMIAVENLVHQVEVRVLEEVFSKLRPADSVASQVEEELIQWS